MLPLDIGEGLRLLPQIGVLIGVLSGVLFIGELPPIGELFRCLVIGGPTPRMGAA